MRQSIFRPAIDRFLDPNDETGGGKPNDSDDTATSAGPKDGESKDRKDEKGPKTFTQEDVNRIVSDRLKEESKKIAKDVRADIEREATEAAAKEQGDFKKLYETEQEAHNALKADVARRDHEDLRKRVASEAKLPDGAWRRLVGETEEELKADAKDMAKTFVSVKDVDTDAGKTRTKSTATVDKDIEKLSKPEAWGLPTR